MKSWITNGLTEVWADVLRCRWTLTALLLLTLLARAQSITTPMYSIDSYAAGDPGGYSLFLAQGRWGLVAALWLETRLGFVGMYVVPSALALSTILLLGAGFLYARVLLTTVRGVELFLFVALFTLHPFNTEFYHFADATFNISLSIFLAAAGLACISSTARPWAGAATGVLLILIASSIYQLVVGHVVVVSLLVIIGWMSSPLDLAPYRSRRVLVGPPLRMFLVVAGAAVISVVNIFVISRVLGIALGTRADLSGILDFKKKATVLMDAFRGIFQPPPGILPPAASVLLIAALSLAVLAILISVQRRRGWGMTLAGGVLIVVAAVCSVAAPVASNVTWLVPRVLSPFSIVSAGIIVLGWRCIRRSWIRHMIAVPLAVLLLAYVGASNRILYDQRRVNLWDMQQANRILTRLEIEPNFSDLRALALVNGAWRRGVALPTAFGDMNISAFAASWAKLPMLMQATGLRFEAPSAAEAQRAETHCSSAGVWPATDSAVIIGTLGIVCLPPPS